MPMAGIMRSTGRSIDLRRAGGLPQRHQVKKDFAVMPLRQLVETAEIDAGSQIDGLWRRVTALRDSEA